MNRRRSSTIKLDLACQDAGCDRVQSKVRVSLRGLLIDLAPVIFPLSVGPQDTKGDHVIQVVQRPPSAGALEPALNDVPMGALDLPRADGQTSGQGPLVIQALSPV